MSAQDRQHRRRSRRRWRRGVERRVDALLAARSRPTDSELLGLPEFRQGVTRLVSADLGSSSRAYTAALVDGEGHFFHGVGGHGVGLKVNNTSRCMVDWLYTVVGWVGARRKDDERRPPLLRVGSVESE